MVEHHGEQFAGRGVEPGGGGAVALHIMVHVGDVYGGRRLTEGELHRVVRTLHAVHWMDPEMVEAGASTSVRLARARLEQDAS